MKKILFCLNFIISFALCSCEMDYAYFETVTSYDVIGNNNDTISFNRVDTLTAHKDASFFAVITNDSTAVLINYSIYSEFNNYNKGRVKLTYPDCKVKINSFYYRKIREYKASSFDGHEIK